MALENLPEELVRRAEVRVRLISGDIAGRGLTLGTDQPARQLGAAFSRMNMTTDLSGRRISGSRQRGGRAPYRRASQAQLVIERE
ncbi:hypothetical protein GCM10009304_14870 [Pseudomonas matsuisoli]|uniref:Uncharacterized protein n=1 Tax=Pseudomonas matsuisoli TaxID=1515666 RepID=A0A917UWN3_9PSED|nr:hypothetical protein GCM10009304_14870 [Pseudomonas matsuisoli]